MVSTGNETESQLQVMGTVTLDKVERLKDARIVRVDGSSALVQRLMAIGFLPGQEVRVVQVAPLGDPLAIELDGWRVSLRKAEAALITVEVPE